MPKALTQVEAEQKVKDYNNEYELVSTYTKTKEPASLKHNCGEVYTVKSFKTFFEGKNKCPKCYPITPAGKSTKPVTETEFLKRLKEQVGNEYTYIGGYTRMSEKTVTLRHNNEDCEDNEFLVAPKMFLGVKQTRCPLCSNKKRGVHLIRDNYLQSLLDDKPYGKDYNWIGKYNNDNKEKLEIKHNVCNQTYFVRPNDFQQGYKCPHCSPSVIKSKNQTLIENILEPHNLKVELEKTFEGLKLINNLPLDIVVNDTYIIEYDGMQHFRPRGSNSDLEQEKFIKTKQRDKTKNEWIINNGNFYFIRIGPKLVEKDIIFIINQLIYEGKLSEETIEKYTLYVYDNEDNVLYNDEPYYTINNSSYFK